MEEPAVFRALTAREREIADLPLGTPAYVVDGAGRRCAVVALGARVGYISRRVLFITDYLSWVELELFDVSPVRWRAGASWQLHMRLLRPIAAGGPHDGGSE